MSRMSAEIKKTDAICLLEKSINKGNIIILFNMHDKEVLSLLSEILQLRSMVNIEVWQCDDESIKAAPIRFISKQDMEEILNVYHMYDFSDKITVISNNDQYASMFNYLKTGILTKQEMVEALLYKL